MLGQMQNWPLLMSKMLDHAENNFATREIVSMLPEGGQFRYTYKDMALRARKLAQALERLGVNKSERVATMMWNTHRHVEAWYAIGGMGAVCHTINPRLFAEQIVYIAGHAQDKVLIFDVTFAPLIEALAPQMPSVKYFICAVGREHMPATKLDNMLCFEDLLAAEDGTYVWPTMDENTACGLCYTSGTTGHPKGVLYSHRSNFLHTLLALGVDTLGISATGTLLPVVPMFHANAWGFPLAATLSGAKMVLNGPHHDPETLHNLIIDEEVTLTGAVPTIWQAMLNYLQATGKGCGKLKGVTIGGSAVPRSMIEVFQRDYGIRVNHAWGMTETSPLGSLGSENGAVMNLSEAEKLNMQVKQGRAVPCVEMAVKDSDGNILPRDGKSSGHLMVRGPWVIEHYFGQENEQLLDADGWFDTGDIANIDPNGYMQITDRSKDVIKSGGEWISSIDLENSAVSHPDVTEAAVIGLPHPKWNERPLLVVTVKDGAHISLNQMHAHLETQVAKWWLPDDLVIVDEIPHTATGKISKKDLREQFKSYRLPTAV